MHNRRVRWLTGPVLAAALLSGPSAAAAAENATLFRVFLNDGTAVLSYGEYARVGDRVIFSMPIGALTPDPQLHVVNLPSSAVDLASTSRYADSMRFSHYVATQAESDYTALTAEVARILNAIVITTEPRARLSLATEARRALADWPGAHYGYRGRDVQQMLGLLDEAISEMKASAGETAFTVDLVAIADPPPIVPPLREPTPVESISQALTVAKLADVPAERVSLLRAIVSAIDDVGNAVPASWAKSTRKWALWTIDQEMWTDREYARVSGVLLRRAASAAERADVRAVEDTIQGVRRVDKELGEKRPESVNALIAALQLRLDAARRLRLLRDQWAERTRAYSAYQRAMAPVVDALLRAERSLDDIKRLAGPGAVTLSSLTDRFAASEAMLGTISVPDELKPAHAILTSALFLARSAVSARRQAVASGDVHSAWDASSAAAGAIMLFARARSDMEAVVKLPQIR